MKRKKCIFYSLLLISGFLHGSNSWFTWNTATPSMYSRPKSNGYFNRQSFNNTWRQRKFSFDANAQKAAGLLGLGALGLSAYYAWKKHSQRNKKEEERNRQIDSGTNFLESKLNELKSIADELKKKSNLFNATMNKSLGLEKIKTEVESKYQELISLIRDAKEALKGNIMINDDEIQVEELKFEVKQAEISRIISSIKKYYDEIKNIMMEYYDGIL